MNVYTPILVLGVLAFGFAAFSIVIASLTGPKRYNRAKYAAYECGIEPEPFQWAQIQIRYYVFAILFLILDVEAVFVFPWAVVFLKSTPAVFYEMLIFIGILFFGVIYGWRKGVLQWR